MQKYHKGMGGLIKQLKVLISFISKQGVNNLTIGLGHNFVNIVAN
jgi:hypothetical protein